MAPLRVLGRWMSVSTIQNLSFVARAWQECGDDNRMKGLPFYRRIVDVFEELFRFTLFTTDRKDYLVNRYSERKAAIEKGR